MEESRLSCTESVVVSSLTVRYCDRNSEKEISVPVSSMYACQMSVMVMSSPSEPFVTVKVSVVPSE